MRQITTAAAMVFSAWAVYAQAPAVNREDPWVQLRVFEGKWEGTASGDPGNGVSSRQYRFDLNGRFLAARSKSVYEPKPPSDHSLKKIVLRQFHAEGFVNEYTLEAVRVDGKELEFVTVRIENIPAGWKAREVYRVISPDEVVEIFSLAGPGKEFAVYSETRLRRVK